MGVRVVAVMVVLLVGAGLAAGQATMPGVAERAVARANVRNLVLEAGKFWDRGQFREAQDVLRQAVVMDREDVAARTMLRMVEDKLNSLQYGSMRIGPSERRTEPGRRDFDIRPLLVGTQGGTLEQRRERAMRVERMRQMVMALIGPETWVERGGMDGVIWEEEGKLVVWQRPERREEVKDFLERYWAMNFTRVAVEVRVVVVSREVMDDFRIGWEKGQGGKDVSPHAVVDDWTLSLLLNAVQGDKRSYSEALPRLLVFPGVEEKMMSRAQEGEGPGLPRCVATVNAAASADGETLAMAVRVVLKKDEGILKKDEAVEEWVAEAKVSLKLGGVVLIDGGETQNGRRWIVLVRAEVMEKRGR